MHKNLYKNNYRYLILFLTVWVLFGFSSVDVKAEDIDSKSLINKVQDLYGNPISNVDISIKGTNIKTTSTEEGLFVIEFKSGDILMFSHDNYLYNETKITVRDTKKGVLVRLQDKLVKNQLTLTGPYGEAIEKSSYLGSASTVYTDKLTTTMGTTILPSLAGRISGFYINQNRGARIHQTATNTTSSIGGYVPVFGQSIFSDNSEFTVSSRGVSPVVIVDGVQREFYALDPEAIESVTLQKDALSSMFLGMQSSRGALIITTKKPTQGTLQVSLTGKLGVNSSLKTLKPLDSYQYAYLLNEALENDGKLPIYSYSDFQKFRDQSSPYTHPNVNWFDELLNDNSISQSYNLNVSGGNKVAQYFVSLGYMGEEGMFRTSEDNSYNTNLNYQRYLITSKVNVNVTKDFTANIMLVGRIENGNQPGGAGNGYEDLLYSIYTTPNSAYPVKNQNGSWGGNISFTNNLMSQTLNSGYIKDDSRDILGTINLNYNFDRLVKGLSVNAVGSIITQTRSMTDRTKRSPVYAYKIDEDGNPTYTMFSTPSPQKNQFNSVGNYQDMYGQIGINYNRRLGEHGLKVSIKGDTRTLINNFDLPEIPSNIMINTSYDYLEKYFVQAALTESYYNRYAPGKRWGTFYAFGLGWDVSKEAFMESADFLDLLKLRGTFGLTGSGITNSGYYIWSQTYSANAAAWYPLGTSQTNGFLTTENTPLANPNITWEKANKFNVGVDVAVLNSKLMFTADYYNDFYFDMLQARGKSIELIGSVYPIENIGELRRSGVELALTYQDKIGRFNYYISGNWSVEQNKLLFIDEQEVPFDYLKRTGRSINSIFGLVADGFLTAEDIANGYPVMEGFDNIQPGDVKYVDMNGDDIIDEFDATVIGGDNPLSFFGLDLGLEFKGFEFSMLWQGVYNRDYYLGDRTFVEGFQSINQHYGQAYEHLLNRWTPENAANATYPRLSAGGNDYNYGNNWGSSLWLKSGNFIRLKNVNVAYTLPESISRNYLGNLRVKFFVSGQNLLTMSAIDLVDPEVGFTGYPLQRNINFGINVKF